MYCINISDRVLIQMCSWVIFQECPLGAGSLLAHIFYSLLFIFIVHTQYTQLKMPLFVILCFSVLGYVVRLLYFIWNCFWPTVLSVVPLVRFVICLSVVCL